MQVTMVLEQFWSNCVQKGGAQSQLHYDFKNAAEKKYSTNELEMLAVV